MRYVTLGGGKRLRAALVYATGEALGAPPDVLNVPACALELVHAYSLVHDDLPAMDNDDLRRGKPTCHKAFDEATAILAGDALQTLAFELLAHDPALAIDSTQRLAMLAHLAQAAGSAGMAGGQAIDLDAVGQAVGTRRTGRHARTQDRCPDPRVGGARRPERAGHRCGPVGATRCLCPRHRTGLPDH